MGSDSRDADCTPSLGALMDSVLSIRESRTVTADYTVRWQGVIYRHTTRGRALGQARGSRGAIGGGESASQTATSGRPATLGRKLSPTARSTHLAGGERFSSASPRASIALARGKVFKRHPLPLALPHPGFKKRNFLLCREAELSILR
jgi:hypothetical protein